MRCLFDRVAFGYHIAVICLVRTSFEMFDHLRKRCASIEHVDAGLERRTIALLGYLIAEGFLVLDDASIVEDRGDVLGRRTIRYLDARLLIARKHVRVLIARAHAVHQPEDHDNGEHHSCDADIERFLRTTRLDERRIIFAELALPSCMGSTGSMGGFARIRNLTTKHSNTFHGAFSDGRRATIARRSKLRSYQPYHA